MIAAGRPALGYAREGVEEYLRRLNGAWRIEAHYVKAGPRRFERMEELAGGCHRIVLDERGRTFDSRGFAAHLGDLRDRSVGEIALMVGPADGWGGRMPRADMVWSLGALTLQHELALVVALEQVYRAGCILAGVPYHRD